MDGRDNEGLTLIIILIGSITIGYFMIKELIRDSLKQRRLNGITESLSDKS